MANDFFNAEYYLAQNADVAEAVGTDVELAEQHYLLHGATEADEGVNTARKPAPWFDIEFYRASNEKLADVPADQLFLHFTLHGMREGLSPMEGVSLDAQAYADANPELVEALGIENAAELSDDDILLLNQHFYAHGYREGLEGGPSIPGYNPNEPELDDLTAALENLQAASTARGDFLKEAAKNADVAAELEAVADLSVEDAIEDVLEDLEGQLEAALESATQEQLEANVVVAQANLAAAQARYDANVGEVEGLKTAVAKYNSEQRKYLSLKDARDSAQSRAEAQFDAFVANSDEEYTAVWDIADTTGGAAIEELGIFDADEVQVVRFEPFNPADITEGGRAVVTAEGAGIAGLNEVVTSVNAWLEANDKLVTQDGERDAAREAVRVIEDGADFAPPLFENVLDRQTELDNAVNAVTAREELIERVEAVQALADQLEVLDEELAAAYEAIEELGFDLVDFDESNEAVGTEANDVFVYVGSSEDNAEFGIDLFGFEGDDVLFVGTQFTYNDDVENGDASVLEVFFTQDGDDTVVTIEKTAFGTNAAEQEIDTITLTGVSAETLSFVDGYVVVA